MPVEPEVKRRSGFDPHQPRDRKGRWVETGAEVRNSITHLAGTVTRIIRGDAFHENRYEVRTSDGQTQTWETSAVDVVRNRDGSAPTEHAPGTHPTAPGTHPTAPAARSAAAGAIGEVYAGHAPDKPQAGHSPVDHAVDAVYGQPHPDRPARVADAVGNVYAAQAPDKPQAGRTPVSHAVDATHGTPAAPAARPDLGGAIDAVYGSLGAASGGIDRSNLSDEERHALATPTADGRRYIRNTGRDAPTALYEYQGGRAKRVGTIPAGLPQDERQARVREFLGSPAAEEQRVVDAVRARSGATPPAPGATGFRGQLDDRWKKDGTVIHPHTTLGKLQPGDRIHTEGQGTQASPVTLAKPNPSNGVIPANRRKTRTVAHVQRNPDSTHTVHFTDGTSTGTEGGSNIPVRDTARNRVYAADAPDPIVAGGGRPPAPSPGPDVTPPAPVRPRPFALEDARAALRRRADELDTHRPGPGGDFAGHAARSTQAAGLRSLADAPDLRVTPEGFLYRQGAPGTLYDRHGNSAVPDGQSLTSEAQLRAYSRHLGQRGIEDVMAGDPATTRQRVAAVREALAAAKAEVPDPEVAPIPDPERNPAQSAALRALADEMDATGISRYGDVTVGLRGLADAIDGGTGQDYQAFHDDLGQQIDLMRGDFRFTNNADAQGLLDRADALRRGEVPPGPTPADDPLPGFGTVREVAQNDRFTPANGTWVDIPAAGRRPAVTGIIDYGSRTNASGARLRVRQDDGTVVDRQVKPGESYRVRSTPSAVESEANWRIRGMDDTALAAEVSRITDPETAAPVNDLAALLARREQVRTGALDAGPPRQAEVTPLWTRADDAMHAAAGRAQTPEDRATLLAASTAFKDSLEEAGYDAPSAEARTLPAQLAGMTDAEVLALNERATRYDGSFPDDAIEFVTTELERRGYSADGTPNIGSRSGMANPQHPSDALVGQRVAYRNEIASDDSAWSVGYLSPATANGDHYLLSADGSQEISDPITPDHYVEVIQPDDPRVDRLDPTEMTTPELAAAITRQQARTAELARTSGVDSREFRDANSVLQDMAREHDSRPADPWAPTDPGGTGDLFIDGQPGPTPPPREPTVPDGPLNGPVGDALTAIRGTNGVSAADRVYYASRLGTIASGGLDPQESHNIVEDARNSIINTTDGGARTDALAALDRLDTAVDTHAQRTAVHAHELNVGDQISYTAADGTVVTGEIEGLHTAGPHIVATLRRDDDTRETHAFTRDAEVNRLAVAPEPPTEDAPARDLRMGQRILLQDASGAYRPATIVHVTRDPGGSGLVMEVMRDNGSHESTIVDPSEVLPRITNFTVDPEPDLPPIPDDPQPEDGTKFARGLVAGDRIASYGDTITVVRSRVSPDGQTVAARIRLANGAEDNVTWHADAVLPLVDQPSTVAVEPHPADAASLRPTLYTYQRKGIVALNLDAQGSSQSPVVQQAAARVRNRQALTEDQNAALADALRAQADAPGVRAPRQRSLQRQAASFDAAAAALGGRVPPVTPNRDTVEKTRPGNLVEGDWVALRGQGAAGGVDVVQVLGMRPMMGGRLHELTVRDQDGNESRRLVAGNADTYLLPDLPRDLPAPPEQPRPEHVTADRITVGDTIRFTYRDPATYQSSVREAVVTDTQKPGGEGSNLHVLTVDVNGASYEIRTTQRSRSDGGATVVRTARGPASQDQAYDSLLPAENPEVLRSVGDVAIGDRVSVPAVIGVDHVGVVHAIEKVSTDDGTPGIRIQLRQDDGDVNTVVIFNDDPAKVTRLAKGDEGAAQRIQQMYAERERQVLANAARRKIEGFRSQILTYEVRPNPYGTPEDAAAGVLRGRDDPGAHPQRNIRTTAKEIAEYLAPDGADEGQRALIAGRVEPILRQVREEYLTSLADSLRQVPPDQAGINNSGWVQRVIDQRKQSPSTRDFGRISRTLADAAASLQGGGDGQQGATPDFTPPEGADLATRIRAYREAIGGNGQGFGKTRVSRTVFKAPTLDDLEAGRVPETETATTFVSDRAADGGPGEVAMRHHDVLLAAGRDLDAEVQRRIVARDSSLGANPEATLADLKTQAKEAQAASSAAWTAYFNVARDDFDARAEARAAMDSASARSQEVNDRYRKLSMRLSRLRREVAMEIIAEHRQIGGEQITWVDNKGKVLGERSKLVKAMRGAEAVYPTEWLQKFKERAQGKWTLKPSKRGHFSEGKREITLSDKAIKYEGGGEQDDVAVHELGHGMEWSVPGLSEAEEAFLWARTSDGPVGSRTRQKQTTIYKGTKEVGFKDDFPEHYTGKTYASWSNRQEFFEVFTTSVESVFAGSGYADEGMRAFTLGSMILL